MIRNACDYPLDANPGTLPNMSDALTNYFQNCNFTRIVTTVVNGQAIEDETTECFFGVVESITPEKLAIKPEGQRSWNWINVWALPTLSLRTDEIIKYEGIKYRVMARYDWSKYGYLQYDLVQDWNR